MMHFVVTNLAKEIFDQFKFHLDEVQSKEGRISVPIEFFGKKFTIEEIRSCQTTRGAVQYSVTLVEWPFA